MKKKIHSEILWWLLVAGTLSGALLTCCDGMINLFNLSKGIQYMWNFAFMFICLPFFAYCFVIRDQYREE